MSNKICGYIRTATNNEEQVKAQRVKLNEYIIELADHYEMFTYHEFIDFAVSGVSDERSGLDSILTMARAGEIDLLVAVDPDRLSRDATQLRKLTEELDNLGVIVEFTDCPNLLTEESVNFDSEFQNELSALFKKYEQKRWSKVIKDALKRKRSQTKTS